MGPAHRRISRALAPGDAATATTRSRRGAWHTKGRATADAWRLCQLLPRSYRSFDASGWICMRLSPCIVPTLYGTLTRCSPINVTRPLNHSDAGDDRRPAPRDSPASSRSYDLGRRDGGSPRLGAGVHLVQGLRESHPASQPAGGGVDGAVGRSARGPLDVRSLPR